MKNENAFVENWKEVQKELVKMGKEERGEKSEEPEQQKKETTCTKVESSVAVKESQNELVKLGKEERGEKSEEPKQQKKETACTKVESSVVKEVQKEKAAFTPKQPKEDSDEAIFLKEIGVDEKWKGNKQLEWNLIKVIKSKFHSINDFKREFGVSFCLDNIKSATEYNIASIYTGKVLCVKNGTITIK